MNKFNLLVIVCIITAYFFTCFYWYNKGRNDAQREHTDQLMQLNIENLKKIRQIEKEQTEKQNLIVEDYLERIDILKNEYEKQISQIKVSNLSGIIDVPKCVPIETRTNTDRRETTNSTKSDIKCYREAELLRKIEASLAIANECDQLALRYNSLLDVCKSK